MLIEAKCAKMIWCPRTHLYGRRAYLHHTGTTSLLQKNKKSSRHPFCTIHQGLMHQSIPSTNIPLGLTPGEFFKVVKFPAPGQKMFAKLRPRGKNRQKPHPWGQFCGPSRQFSHDRETIRIFLVLFFSLAFFEFFQRL